MALKQRIDMVDSRLSTIRIVTYAQSFPPFSEKLRAFFVFPQTEGHKDFLRWWLLAVSMP